MQIVPGGTYSVVTGDVVGSSGLHGRRRKALLAAMRDTSDLLRATLGDVIPFDVDVFRGDSWQFVVTKPELALRAALLYRAGLRMAFDIDSRAVLGVGDITFVPNERVSQGDGEAFQLSGRALETLPRNTTLALVYPATPSERGLNVLLRLMGWIASRWTQRQARAVTGALRGWTQEQIAREAWETPITQQAVAQHLERAGWDPIEHGVTYFEVTLREGQDR